MKRSEQKFLEVFIYLIYRISIYQILGEFNMANEMVDELRNSITNGATDVYIYIGSIDGNIQNLRNLINTHPNKRNEADLFLTTYGGDPDWAYRLVSILRKYYKKINVIISGPCKSAGTLVALGADSLRFHEYGELGPLDVQMKRKDNLLGYNSGLDVFQALSVINNSARECFHSMFLEFVLKGGGSISTEIAAKIAKDLSVGIYSAIVSKIDPLELGEKNRAMQIAAAYGERLCWLTKCSNAKNDTLTKLISDYPSHGFVIDMEQAKKLFNHVEPMTENDYKIYNLFKDDIANPTTPLIIDLNNQLGLTQVIEKDFEHDSPQSSASPERIEQQQLQLSKRSSKRK